MQLVEALNGSKLELSSCQTELASCQVKLFALHVQPIITDTVIVALTPSRSLLLGKCACVGAGVPCEGAVRARVSRS